MVEKFRVRYDVKNTDRTAAAYGLLTEKSQTFDTLQLAISFIRDIRAGRVAGKVCGRPVLERVD